MGDPAGSIWFQGDWRDPWVDEIAITLLPLAAVRRIDALDELPAAPNPPDVLVVHRDRLVARDADRFAAWRRQLGWAEFPTSILCYGPFARYAELERWLPLFEQAIPDATALDTLPRRVALRLGLVVETREPTPGEAPTRVAVNSTNGDLQRTISDLCAEWGHMVVSAQGPRPGGPSKHVSSRGGDAMATVTILDVPLLEAEWELHIERAARLGPVIALLGFPDREIVRKARRLGARACLELPFDRDDLRGVLTRCLQEAPVSRGANRIGIDSGHRLPPPASFRPGRLEPSRRDARLLPDRGVIPTMETDCKP